MLQKQLSLLKTDRLTELDKLEKEHVLFVQKLDEDKHFLRQTNYGAEFMSIADQLRIKAIADYKIENEQGEFVKFLSENEVYNLNISRGTLTAEERTIINNHIINDREAIKMIIVAINYYDY